MIDLSKGSLGNNPMMFIEYNNQFVLSIEDTLYMGRYILDEEKIQIYLNNPTKFKMKSLIGSLKSNEINGKIDENRYFEMIFDRIDGDKDYLNNLYK